MPLLTERMQLCQEQWASARSHEQAHAGFTRALEECMLMSSLSPGTWPLTTSWAGRAAHRAAVRDGDAHFPGAGPRGHRAARGLEGGASNVALLGVLHVLVAVVHGHVPEPDHVYRRQPCMHQLRYHILALQAMLQKGPSSLFLHWNATANAQGGEQRSVPMARYTHALTDLSI